MDGEDSAEDEASQACLPSPSPAQPIDGSPSPEADAAHPSEQAGDPIDHNKRVADWTKRLTLVTIALAILALFQLSAGILQWCSMNRQADISDKQLAFATDSASESSQDTKAALKVAENQAESSATSARAAQASAEAAGRQVDEIRGEQRAWISVSARITGDLFRTGDSWGLPVQITLKNEGRTPAMQAIFSMGADLIEPNRMPVRVSLLNNGSRRRIRGSLPPKYGFDIMSGQTITKDAIAFTLPIAANSKIVQDADGVSIIVFSDIRYKTSTDLHAHETFASYNLIDKRFGAYFPKSIFQFPHDELTLATPFEGYEISN